MLITDHQQALRGEAQVPGCSEHAWMRTFAPEAALKEPSSREHGDPVVFALGHDDVPMAIKRHSKGGVEVPSTCPVLPHLLQQKAEFREDVETVVALISYHHTIVAGCNAYYVHNMNTGGVKTMYYIMYSLF